ncbi:MAG TPA: hypothetical protein VGO52_09180 [Hyphomonadaceae bacterium]|nr:hypothetical protein [Hyphomonadaceae bacterium]
MTQSGEDSGQRKYRFAPQRTDVLGFRKMIREAGYNDYVDTVSIHPGEWPSKPVDRVVIQPGFEQLVRFLGAASPTGPDPKRIEILTNDPDGTLERGLDVTELVDWSVKFGITSYIYKGVVSAGKDVGAIQIWRLDYER